MGQIKKNQGYTLIELVLLMSLIIILAVSAIPFFINVGETKAEAAAKKLISDLTYARQLARNYNDIHGISFDSAAETYTVHQYNPSTFSSTTVTDPLTRSNMVINYSQIAGLSGVNIQSVNFGGTSIIRFSTMGAPQDGNGTDLATAGTVVLEEGGVTRTIQVQPNTGEISQQ